MAGCEGKGGSEPAQPALETVTYSNLTDADSRALLSGLLEKSGVAEARIQALLACVDQFNAAVKPAWLTDGFESAAPTETKYDVYDMQDVWTEKYALDIRAASLHSACLADFWAWARISRRRWGKYCFLWI